MKREKHAPHGRSEIPATFNRPLLSVLLFLVLLVAALAGFLILFSPPIRTEGISTRAVLDSSELRKAFNRQEIDALRTKIASFGPRGLAQPGHAAVADFLAGQLRADGLQVIERRDMVVAPVTDISEILFPDGHPLPGVELHPFMPNLFQPVATPEGGLKGRLVLLDKKTIATRDDFSGIIGVVDMADAPYDLDWSRYAQLGISGLIITGKGAAEAAWTPLLPNKMVSTIPVNFLRAYTTPEILKHLGREVSIRLEQRYREVENTSIIGVLKAAKPTRQALVITGHYDTYGILPSMVDGSIHAFSPAMVLSLARGLSLYRDTLQRDVIFILDGAEMMGGIGEAAVVAAFGPADAQVSISRRIEGELAENTRSLRHVDACLDLMKDPLFLSDPEVTLRDLSKLDPGARAFLDAQTATVLNTLVFESGEQVLQAKLAIARAGNFVSSGPLYDNLQKALAYQNAFKAASSASVATLLEKQIGTIASTDMRKRLQERIGKLAAYHRFKQGRLESDRSIHELASSYQSVIAASPRMLPASGEPSTSSKSSLALLPSDSDRGGRRFTEGLEREMPPMLQDVIRKAEFRKSIELGPFWQPAFSKNYQNVGQMPVGSKFWNQFLIPGFTVVNTDRLASYQKLLLPRSSEREASSEGLGQSLDFFGDLALTIASRPSAYRPPAHALIRSLSGRALASNVGSSVVPNFALEGTLVGATVNNDDYRDKSPGHFRQVLLMTDPYGRFELAGSPADFTLDGENLSPQAFWFGKGGGISWVKDVTGSTLFKSEKLPMSEPEHHDVNLVLFRVAPVSFLDLTDPQSMRDYTDTSLLTREGLSPFVHSATYKPSGDKLTGGVTLFVPPGEFFYAAMRGGEADNPLLQSIRSFLINPGPTARSNRSGGINGAGYLPADHPIFPSMNIPMAESMLSLNSERASLQKRRHMVDGGTEEFIERSRKLLDAALAPGTALLDSLQSARESAAYSTLIHPILRSNISGAVMSILWYLGLLVPFTFFFEKLVTGFSDIRRQLAAQVLIFLSVFLMLRLMHPAFEIIRSSVMVLLGFVILLIAGGMTLLFAGKFRQNLELLQRLRGNAEGAGVNTMGIVMTSFMLGLNNMHRRKVRTGLTCATLILITFAMIAFTSVRSGLTEKQITLGPAPYQGLLVKKQNGRPLEDSEIIALKSRFREQFPVCTRSYYVGSTSWPSEERNNPEIEIRPPEGAFNGRSTKARSILLFESKEPLAGKISLLTKPYWFPSNPTRGEPRPVIISDRIAADLGVTPEQVNGPTSVRVTINGAPFRVAGIFDSQKLNDLHDIDGRGILPPDITALHDLVRDSSYNVVFRLEDPRILAEDVVLMSSKPDTDPANGKLQKPSCAVILDKLGYREARDVVFRFLEQTGTTNFFGLNGVAYSGSCARSSSVQGLLDMIMPLVIAALTVLNTMKGSVYERRDEIYVYNAVGIAPRYIFFMFFAEAFVYSVVGAVLGYLLAQGTGYVLTLLDLTGGLNMTFAGPSTIIASLAVSAAVFFSTIFPARTAMKIAAPSEDSGWSMPDPEGDEISFTLPFTFTPRERISVIAFFHRFLVDHGEGGSGSFHAGPPRPGIGGGEDLVPMLKATIWLKPYDLGVSEEMTISLPFDEETEEYIARVSILRLSGTRESWTRLNRTLVAGLRERFLHWRAVPSAQKERFYTEACELLAQESRKQPSSHHHIPDHSAE